MKFICKTALMLNFAFLGLGIFSSKLCKECRATIKMC